MPLAQNLNVTRTWRSLRTRDAGAVNLSEGSAGGLSERPETVTVTVAEPVTRTWPSGSPGLRRLGNRERQGHASAALVVTRLSSDGHDQIIMIFLNFQLL
jgi:hypothetical protein